ncbi:hypothetical protein [Gordonia sp. MP11Mi]|uniref:Uncharacterized protein n=1 Tax=Gordonia sp. MP11Mi TaxID=3022769 RepID=A0AA97GU66_9ACTN
MTRRAVDQAKDSGAWLEAISLFEAVRHGQRQTAGRQLRTAVDPDKVTDSLLSLLGVLLRGADSAELDRFVEAARRAGPPPPIEARPDQAFAHVSRPATVHQEKGRSDD